MKTRIFGYRIVIRMVMVFVLLFTLTGCGDNKVKDTTGSGLDASEGMDIYSIYYMNGDWTDFVVKRTNIDQLEATENTIDKLMNLLITSTDDKNCQIPVLQFFRFLLHPQPIRQFLPVWLLRLPVR